MYEREAVRIDRRTLAKCAAMPDAYLSSKGGEVWLSYLQIGLVIYRAVDFDVNWRQ